MDDNFASFLFNDGTINKLQLSYLLKKHSETNQKFGSLVFKANLLSKEETISKLKDFSKPE